jgi:hypothetical protein
MMGSLMLRRELVLPVPRPRLFPQRGGTMKGVAEQRSSKLCALQRDRARAYPTGPRDASGEKAGCQRTRIPDDLTRTRLITEHPTRLGSRSIRTRRLQRTRRVLDKQARQPGTGEARTVGAGRAYKRPAPHPASGSSR